jgi:cyclophilin family peptidyl-prolyl cis-trans isomerase
VRSRPRVELRRIGTATWILAATAVVATLAACSSDASTASSSSAAATTSSTPPPTTGAIVAGCPNPDGSSPKHQKFLGLPPTCTDPATTYVATITTNHGTLHVTLDQQLAPKTVNSIVFLARYHYFDDTPCHRAIPGFVVQCGDPTGTGTGGPGYETPVEVGGFTAYAVGDVAMAKVGGAKTNGSQFFVISGAQGAALAPDYSLFGKVEAADMSVVAALDALGNPDPTAGGVPPRQPITVQSVTISPPT